jgi:tannase/feruloyl esterase
MAAQSKAVASVDKNVWGAAYRIWRISRKGDSMLHLTWFEPDVLRSCRVLLTAQRRSGGVRLLESVLMGAVFAILCPCVRAQSGPVIRCDELRSVMLPGLVVDEAKIVPAGPVEAPPDQAPAPAPGTMVPEHCLFRGRLDPRRGPNGEVFGIGIEMRLPTQWNGRFAFEGGGGLDGIQRPSYGSVWDTIRPPALVRGFAVVATDGGHRSPSMSDAHFGLDQQARIDYAYNAVDKTTLVGKILIGRYYGRAPQHSYFIGCSNGGRQALIVAQRLPLQFDGVVSGDPSLRLAWTNVDQAWNEVVLARAAPRDAQGQPIISQAMSAADLKLVSNAVVKECDAKDGLADGMINNYPACRFDPAVLTCKGEKTASCLAPAQVTALKALMGGPHDSHGHALYAAFPYDAGIADPAFQHMHFGTSPTAATNSADAILGFGALRYYAFAPPDPGFDPMHFDFDRDTVRVLETSKLNDADAAYLQSFAHHGKLILYHGMSDQGLSPLDTAAWYDRLGPATGGRTQDWARLFLVPGMTHCSGGPATDEFDMLTSIQAWVEDGHAPDRIVAKGKSFPGVTRPLCAYPQIARYTGGDPKSEGSFTCTAPQDGKSR